MVLIGYLVVLMVHQVVLEQVVHQVLLVHPVLLDLLEHLDLLVVQEHPAQVVHQDHLVLQLKQVVGIGIVLIRLLRVELYQTVLLD